MSFALRSRLARFRPTRRLGFAIAVLALLIVQAGVGSTPSRASSISFQQAGQPPAHGGNRQTSLSQELVKETREAAAEDSDEQFKHSASVQFIARVSGLSIKHAYLLCTLLNFAVIGILIVWLLRKTLPSVFRNRTAAIQKAMEEARRASEEAKSRLAGIEERLSQLAAEIAQLRSAAEAEGAAEESRIRAAAEEDARKILEDADFEIQAAVKAARRDLKVYAADIAVALARKQVRVDGPTDQALVLSFARRLWTGDNDTKGRR